MKLPSLRLSLAALCLGICPALAFAKAPTEPIAPQDLVFEEIDGIAAVEAEHFLSQETHDVRAWHRIAEDSIPELKPDPDGPHLVGASGGMYLEALPDSRWSHGEKLIRGENFFKEPGLAGVLTYKIHFNNPGRYYVWVRHYSTGSEDNGMHVGLNGEWPASGARWQTTIKRQWAWECRQRTDEVHIGVPYQLYLDIPTAGVHRIHFSMREDGFEFDKFILASNRDYVPQELGPDPIVKAGTAPRPQPLSKDYEEILPPPPPPKVGNIKVDGVKYRASESPATAKKMTQPVAKKNLVFEEVDGLLAIEAEHFLSQHKDDIRAWFRIEEEHLTEIKPDIDPPHLVDSSGGSYLEALPDSRWSGGQRLIHGENFYPEPDQAGILTYKAHFNTPGRYYVWVRHFSTGPEDNGMHVGLNGEWPESGKRWQTTKKREWAWECRQRTELVHAGVPHGIYLDIPSAGVHRIHFSMREDGMEFDKFLLTTDKSFVPEGLGPDPVVKSGKAPEPLTLSPGYVDANSSGLLRGPAVPLPKGTVRLPSTQFNIEGSDFYVDERRGNWLAIDPSSHKSATASGSTPVGNAAYTVIFHAVGENDGESHFEIKIGGRALGEFTCPLSLDTYEIGPKYTKVFEDVYISEGTDIEVTATIASAGGLDFSRGRWLGLTFLPADATPQQIASARRGLEDPMEKASKVDIAISGELKQWHKVTIDLAGPHADERDTEINPFLDYRYELKVTHATGSPSYTIPGYFAADGDAANTSATAGNVWRAHFTPNKTGDWYFTTVFLQGPGVAIGDNAGFRVEPYHEAEGGFTIAASDKTGRDFRGQGRLEYVGKHHLQFAGSGKYFLKAGPDAPETLLAYTDFDDTETRLPEKGPLKTWEPHLQDWKSGDPTWKDGKGKALIGAMNYLASKGVNAFSFLTYNAGGDGDNIWPYVERDLKFHFDTSKLDQWGIVFDHAQAKGLFLHFKLQENELDDNRAGSRKTPKLIPESLDGGATGPERKLYLREIIARFGHHLALNWNLGEESTQTYEEQVAMSEYIHKTDPYGHLIVIHTFPSQQNLVYSQLLGDRSLVRGASTQNKWNAAHQFTHEWVTRSAETGIPWVVPNDEQNPAGAGVPPDIGYKGGDGLSGDRFGNYDMHGIRKYTLWGNLMAGGAGVEYYFGYKLMENDLLCEDWRSRDKSWDYCRIAIEFFQNNEIPFWEMATANALVGNPENDNSLYCFAKPDHSYVIYLPTGGSADLDLSGATGSYDVYWYDSRNGGELQTGKVKRIEGGSVRSIGSPPSDSEQDWAVLVRRR